MKGAKLRKVMVICVERTRTPPTMRLRIPSQQHLDHVTWNYHLSVECPSSNGQHSEVTGHVGGGCNWHVRGNAIVSDK